MTQPPARKGANTIMAKRSYETPTLHSETLQLGVFGDYDDETAPFMPIDLPGPRGQKIRLD
jgi:hypothetical protein